MNLDQDLSVGQRVQYRRLGENACRTGEGGVIYPEEYLFILTSGEIVRMDCLLPDPGYQHPTWQERCKQLETALAAALELKRRAAQPECEPDFKQMPTYVKNLHAQLFAALPTPDSQLPT